MYSDLYKDILAGILARHAVEICFTNFNAENLNGVLENICYVTLQRIRNVLDDDTLDDFECIEQIVRLFEEIGSSGGSRHDF